MFEKVNPCHPDKVADRIAGAIVDLAYKREKAPRCAVEVLIGHGFAYIIIESSVDFSHEDVEPIVHRIAGKNIYTVRLLSIPQDTHLADNQRGTMRCGDNGIFNGTPVSSEEKELTHIADVIYTKYHSDGKYIIANNRIIACQSCAEDPNEVALLAENHTDITVNPLGAWTGGTDVDSGATNRKLGSDMGRAVTGGGLHGKDLSKADVSVNIMCHLLAQEHGEPVAACCAIGDERIIFSIKDRPSEEMPYKLVVKRASEYIQNLGGFEKFAEWGLIRPE